MASDRETAELLQETRRPKLTATMSESEDESPVEMGPLDAGDDRILLFAEGLREPRVRRRELRLARGERRRVENRIEAYIRGARARR